MGDQGIFDASIVPSPQLAARALVKGMDAVTELAGADLTTAPEGELLLQLAECPAKLGLVGLRRDTRGSAA